MILLSSKWTTLISSLGASLLLVGCSGATFSQSPASNAGLGVPGTTPSPGTSANPNPGTSGNPNPGTSGNPNPGTSGNPNPGTSGNPNPGTSGNPNPGTSGNPNPGTSGNPNPGTSGNPNPNPSGDPGTPPPVVCDPGSNNVPVAYGLRGKVYSATSSEEGNVETMIHGANSRQVNADLFLSQLYIPTVRFSEGFTTTDGNKLKDNNGQTLVEDFALELESQLTLQPSDEEGDYQIGIISDDGSRLDIIESNGQFTSLIDNDGLHSTKMGCSIKTVHLNHGDVVPFRLRYYQGPREHIALVMVWRKVDPGTNNDVECGVDHGSNEYFWDSNASPSAPSDKYAELLDRGWHVPQPKNFLLKDNVKNPCGIDTTPVTQVTTGATCGSYVELADDAFTVPARDGKNVCYFKKLINQQALADSDDFKDMLPEIKAADHDGVTAHPRLMDESKVRFNMLGEREVILAGDQTGANSIVVDNFILLQIKSIHQHQLLGYGTGDAVPGSGVITKGRRSVTYQSYDKMGPATIAPINLSAKLPLFETIFLRTDALDNGVLGQTSDVYLLFR